MGDHVEVAFLGLGGDGASDGDAVCEGRARADRLEPQRSRAPSR